MIRKYHQHTLTALSLFTLSVCHVAYAAETDISPTNQPNIAQAGSETQIYTTPVEISLYQLALRSGITVEALRTLNNGTVDGIDNLPAMQSILLPKNSSLFVDQKEEEVSAISTLPELGGNGDIDPTTAQMLLDKTPVGGYVTGTTEENVANITQSAATQDWNNLTSEKIKDDAEVWAKSTAKQAIMAPIQKGANDLLGRFGKGSVNISIDEHGSLKGSTLSVLSPWYDDKENLVFSQVGVHHQNGDRIIGNFGLGYRYEQDNYLVGGNVFIDHDFTGSNTRLGLGTEFWMDYVKLAANYYMPLSDWKDSEVILDFEERPARGFDIRAQGYLPDYPQLGASLKYEQYFGEQVALFGDNEDSLQRDPKAISIGVDYTPIPLLTFKAEQRFGDNGKKDSRFDMNLNLQLGTPLEKQLDPANVPAMRSLRGSRYDLVDRNYDIVFEYRQKAFQVSFNLPSPYTIDLDDILDLKLITTSQTPITKVVWSIKTVSGAEVTEGFSLTDLMDNDLNIKFKPRDLDKYVLIATVTNQAGITVTSAPFILNTRLKGGSLTDPRIVFTEREDGALTYPTKPLPADPFFAYPDEYKAKLSVKAAQYDQNGENEQPYTIENGYWWIKVTNEEGDVTYVDTSNSTAPNIGDLDGIMLVTHTTNTDVGNGYDYELVSAIDFNGKPVMVEIGYGAVNGVSIKTVKREIYFRTFDANNLVLRLYNTGKYGKAVGAERKLMEPGDFLKPDTYYELVILDKQINKDVTEQFVNGIRWHYYDPYLKQTINLDACSGYTMFSTQRTNFDNNEFSWGSLLASSIQTEQERQLRPSIDPSNWNPKGFLNRSDGPERRLVGSEFHGNVYCPDAGPAVAAELNYVGYKYVSVNGQG